MAWKLTWAHAHLQTFQDNAIEPEVGRGEEASIAKRLAVETSFHEDGEMLGG